MNEDFPAPRRQTVELGVAGSELIRFGDTHPNLCGWVISWQTDQGIAGALPQCQFTCQDRWFQQAQLSFGDENLSPSVSVGGRVYVPYPTVVMEFFDAGGIGAVTIEVIARPILIGQDPGAKTTLTAWRKTAVAAAGNAQLEVPQGAFAYFSTKTAFASDVTVVVQSGAAFGTDWDAYTLSNGDFPSGQHTPYPWRPLPPVDAGSPGQIDFTNNDGATGADLATTFLFDFSAGR